MVTVETVAYNIETAIQFNGLSGLPACMAYEDGVDINMLKAIAWQLSCPVIDFFYFKHYSDGKEMTQASASYVLNSLNQLGYGASFCICIKNDYMSFIVS